jgi:hypothetical protein
MEQRPESKEQLTVANNVLKLAGDLLKVCMTHRLIVCMHHRINRSTKRGKEKSPSPFTGHIETRFANERGSLLNMNDIIDISFFYRVSLNANSMVCAIFIRISSKAKAVACRDLKVGLIPK